MARHFTGRTTELAELTELLGHTDTVVITAIDGMAGIGKTTTVVHWAHRVADHFPDGQFYVNLRGFDASGSVMAPEEALRYLLDALGVPTDLAPAGLDVLAAKLVKFQARYRLSCSMNGRSSTNRLVYRGPVSDPGGSLA